MILRNLLIVLACCSVVLLGVDSPEALAVTYSTIYSFNYAATDGCYPIAGVTKDSAGNFYGTTSQGGTYNYGTVYKLTPKADGTYTETVVYNLGGSNDGKITWSGVLLGLNGNLFGVTVNGGQLGLKYGTFYEVSPTSKSEIGEYSFNVAGGAAQYDLGNLIQDPQGNFYGTSSIGGQFSSGAVWKISIKWPVVIETVIYNFRHDALFSDGMTPRGALVMDAFGNLYGTTSRGGDNGAGCGRDGCGIVFKLTPPKNGGTTWNEAVMHNFNLTAGEGMHPWGSLAIDNLGNLYGTTLDGGSNNNGTVFMISPSGLYTTLHRFTGGTSDGSHPYGGVLVSGGEVYGTTYLGGATNHGVIYKLSPAGGVYTQTILHHFALPPNDGGNPYSNLLRDASGNLYGTSMRQGAHNCGTVFKITP